MTVPIFAASSTGTGFIANAVNFDGSTTFLTRGANLTGLSNGKAFSCSVWVKRSGSGIRTITNNTSDNKMTIRIQADNSITVLCKNAAGSFICSHTASTPAIGTDWVNILVGVDLAASTLDIFVDDTALTFTPTLVNDTIDFNTGDWEVGSAGTGNKFNGDTAEFWWNDTLIDFTTESNRRKFRDANGKPVFLGPTGNFPTGSDAKIYLRNPTVTWQTNVGSGGGFTENGTLTTAATSPSD